MKIDRTRVLLIFLLVMLTFGLLTLIFWSFVRDAIIVPIYYFLWIAGLVLNSLPQAVYLVALVLISLAISLNTLAKLRVRHYRLDAGIIPPQTETRYSYWKRLSAHLYLSRFSKNLFTSEIRKLILSILAHEYRLEPIEIEVLIRRGALPVPETIRHLIDHGEIEIAEQPSDLLSRVQDHIQHWLRPTDAARERRIDDRLAEIITFIEQHLEITNVGDYPES